VNEEVEALLRDMLANDYPNGNEWGEYQDRIEAVLSESETERSNHE